MLRTLATRGALPPTIMVTGHGDEAVAVEAMKLGAGDYLVKDVEGRYLTLLPTVVARVLHQQRLRGGEAAGRGSAAADAGGTGDAGPGAHGRAAAGQCPLARRNCRAPCGPRRPWRSSIGATSSFWTPRVKAFMASTWRAAPPSSTRPRRACSGGKSRTLIGQPIQDIVCHTMARRDAVLPRRVPDPRFVPGWRGPACPGGRVLASRRHVLPGRIREHADA